MEEVLTEDLVQQALPISIWTERREGFDVLKLGLSGKSEDEKRKK